MEPTRPTDQTAARNRSGESTQQPSRPTEFKVARQPTRYAPADIAKALGVSRSTVSRWESGELEPSPEILDWLRRNRNQSVLNRMPLGGLDEPRGFAQRQGRAAVLLPLTSVMAKAAEK